MAKVHSARVRVSDAAGIYVFTYTILSTPCSPANTAQRTTYVHTTMEAQLGHVLSSYFIYVCVVNQLRLLQAKQHRPAKNAA